MTSLSNKSKQVKPDKKIKGFFLVPRDIARLDIFRKKPFTKDRALFYLISHAVFKNNVIELERQGCKVEVKVNRNELFTSRLELRERWGRSLWWIDRFLAELEEKKLIKFSVVRTALKTKKPVNASSQRDFRKTRQPEFRKIGQLGIRINLLFLNNLDEGLKQKQVNRILEKPDNAKMKKPTAKPDTY